MPNGDVVAKNFSVSEQKVQLIWEELTMIGKSHRLSPEEFIIVLRIICDEIGKQMDLQIQSVERGCGDPNCVNCGEQKHDEGSN